MTTIIVFAEASDGYVRSSSTNYSTALAGTSALLADDTFSRILVGQWLDASAYRLHQGGIDFDGSAVASNNIAVASWVKLKTVAIGGADTSTVRNLELRQNDWGGVLNTTDWETPAGLNALTLESVVSNIHTAAATNNSTVRAGQTQGVDPGESYTINSNRNRNQNTPTTDERNQFWSSDVSGTGSDPALYYTTYPESVLGQVLSAQVQLSDGTHVYLEADPTTVAPQANKTIRLKHHDGSSATTVATLLTDNGEDFGSLDGPGSQAFAVVVDNLDNIFVLGRKANTDNTLAAKAYTKGSGYSWTAQAHKSASMPSYNGIINNVVAAWHDEGTSGTIIAFVSHTAGDSAGNPASYALINVDHLLNGTGSFLRNSGTMTGLFLSTAITGFNNFQNETGTQIDICASPDSTDRGYYVSTTQFTELGNNGTILVGRYTLASGGASISDVDVTISGLVGGSAKGVKDANEKSRMIGISDTEFVLVSADQNSGFGLTVLHAQNIGTEGIFTLLSLNYMDEEELDSLPDGSSAFQRWDAVYNSLNNKLYIYYIDETDENNLMKTGVDLNTGLPDQTETVVNSSVGATGSTNHAIRTHRGLLNDDQVLITIANETSGGTHSNIYVVDSLNVAPTAPTLTVHANFDADNSTDFLWTFNDPNAGDTQSAYQLQINTSAGATAVDTGKTVSSTSSHTLSGGSIANDEDWQWRVKTWDASDLEGEWSDFSTFSTSSSGTVTIIDPAQDNPEDVITDDYLIEWEVAGTTQDDYRVVVVRTDTEAELIDTDWVNSDDVTYLVEGMLSDIEYRIEVTVRDSVAVETNTDSVLITPNYSKPVKPVISAVAVDDGGYILITVENPAAGDDLTATDEFEEDTEANYEALGADLEVSNAQAYAGTGSMQMTVTGAPATANFRQIDDFAVPVVANQQYTVNFQAYSPTGSQVVQTAIDWYSGEPGSLVLLSTDNTSATISEGTWTERNGNHFAPSGSTYAKYGPTLGSSPATGTVLFVDNLDMRNASNQPSPSSNHIYRKINGSEDPYIKIAEIDPEETYRDYDARSDYTYAYIAQAVV